MTHSTVPLKGCGSCKTMRYCSKECQRRAWPDHKYECPYLENFKDFGNPTYVQMVGNTILKIKGKDWKTIREIPNDPKSGNSWIDSWGFEEEYYSGSFDDLSSDKGVVLDAIDSVFNFKTIKCDVEKYIGKRNMPSDEILKEIMGKVHYNSLNFYEPTNSPNLDFFVCGLCIGFFRVDHSCVPNSVQIFNGKECVIRAFKVFPKTERITIPNGPLLTNVPFSELKKHMERYNASIKYCRCIDCSRPFGESPLTRIIDQSKATAVLDETDSILEAMSLLAKHKRVDDSVTRSKLSRLLARQEGVLGRTNLRRLRTLAAKALHTDGTRRDMKRDLTELADAMQEVWGEFFPELTPVYMKLQALSTEQKYAEEARNYTKKISQLQYVVQGHTFISGDPADVDLLGGVLQDIVGRN